MNNSNNIPNFNNLQPSPSTSSSSLNTPPLPNNEFHNSYASAGNQQFDYFDLEQSQLWSDPSPNQPCISQHNLKDGIGYYAEGSQKLLDDLGLGYLLKFGTSSVVNPGGSVESIQGLREVPVSTGTVDNSAAVLGIAPGNNNLLRQVPQCTVSVLSLTQDSVSRECVARFTCNIACKEFLQIVEGITSISTSPTNNPQRKSLEKWLQLGRTFLGNNNNTSTNIDAVFNSYNDNTINQNQAIPPRSSFESNPRVLPSVEPDQLVPHGRQEEYQPFQLSSGLHPYKVDSVKSFKKLEKKLNSELERKIMVRELAKTGGKNYENATKRVMGEVLPDSLAVMFSWAGRKGKQPFKNYENINEVVFAAVEKMFNGTTKNDVEGYIKNKWLRCAQQRINGKNGKQAATKI